MIIFISRQPSERTEAYLPYHQLLESTWIKGNSGSDWTGLRAFTSGTRQFSDRWRNIVIKDIQRREWIKERSAVIFRRHLHWCCYENPNIHYLDDLHFTVFSHFYQNYTDQFHGFLCWSPAALHHRDNACHISSTHLIQEPLWTKKQQKNSEQQKKERKKLLDDDTSNRDTFTCLCILQCYADSLTLCQELEKQKLY